MALVQQDLGSDIFWRAAERPSLPSEADVLGETEVRLNTKKESKTTVPTTIHEMLQSLTTMYTVKATRIRHPIDRSSCPDSFPFHFRPIGINSKYLLLDDRPIFFT